MPHLLSDLWIVQTSNNLGSFSDCDAVYSNERLATASAKKLTEENYNGRSDYVASRLVDAIKERVDSACADAMDEG